MCPLTKPTKICNDSLHQVKFGTYSVYWWTKFKISWAVVGYSLKNKTIHLVWDVSNSRRAQTASTDLVFVSPN